MVYWDFIIHFINHDSDFFFFIQFSIISPNPTPDKTELENKIDSLLESNQLQQRHITALQDSVKQKDSLLNIADSEKNLLINRAYKFDSLLHNCQNDTQNLNRALADCNLKNELQASLIEELKLELKVLRDELNKCLNIRDDCKPKLEICQNEHIEKDILITELQGLISEYLKLIESLNSPKCADFFMSREYFTVNDLELPLQQKNSIDSNLLNKGLSFEIVSKRILKLKQSEIDQFKEAYENNAAPKVLLEATNEKTLDIIEMDVLVSHAFYADKV